MGSLTRLATRTIRVLASVVLVATTACGSSGDSGSTDTAGPLTRDSLSSLWGIALPEEVGDYAATRIDDTEGHVTFTASPGDVDAMLGAADLSPTAGNRVITHASPLWDLNPEGEIAGVTDTTATGTRAVEVISAADGDTVTVRAILTTA